MANEPSSLLSSPTTLPLLPLRDVVVFPHMVIPLFVGRPKSIKALDVAMEAGKHILLVAQRQAAKDDPGVDDLYDIGTIATVLQMLKLPDGTVKVLVEGTQRARIGQVTDHGEYMSSEAEPQAADAGPAHEVEAMRRALLTQFDQYVKLNKKIPPEILTSMSGIDVRISGGIFLLSFTYWSNCVSSARRIASTSCAGPASAACGSASDDMYSPWSVTWPMRARCVPSTSTLTVPSGSLSICSTVAMVPMSYRSSTPGSSLAACRCATSRMCLPASIATSSALIDFGRPTNSGITMCGKTTTSRSGSSGSVVREESRELGSLAIR